MSANETNCLLAEKFSETYGVINYGSGWKKDVVNHAWSLPVNAANGGKRHLITRCLWKTLFYACDLSCIHTSVRSNCHVWNQDQDDLTVVTLTSKGVN